MYATEAVEVVIESSWLDYVIAFGTIGTAVVAAWAALSATSAARATRDLVEVERDRDDERKRDQVHRVAVDLKILSRVAYANAADEHRFRVRIINNSLGPLRYVRVRVAIGGKQWVRRLSARLEPVTPTSLRAPSIPMATSPTRMRRFDSATSTTRRGP